MDWPKIINFCSNLFGAIAAILYCEEWWRNRRHRPQEGIMNQESKSLNSHNKWQSLALLVLVVCVALFMISSRLIVSQLERKVSSLGSGGEQTLLAAASESPEELKARFENCRTNNFHADEVVNMGREAFLKGYSAESVGLFIHAQQIDPRSLDNENYPYYAGALMANGATTEGEQKFKSFEPVVKQAIENHDGDLGNPASHYASLRHLCENIENVRQSQIVPEIEKGFIKQEWDDIHSLIPDDRNP